MKYFKRIKQKGMEETALYKKQCFAEYGRKPQSFRSRLTGRQGIIQMELGLNDK